jgi:hypothetical protein
MMIQVSLEHSRYKERKQKAQILGIDPVDIAGIAQSHGQRGVRGLISEIISRRLPSHFANFEVVDWELVDER